MKFIFDISRSTALLRYMACSAESSLSAYYQNVKLCTYTYMCAYYYYYYYITVTVWT